MIAIGNMASFQRDRILENSGFFLENYDFSLSRRRVSPLCHTYLRLFRKLCW